MKTLEPNSKTTPNNKKITCSPSLWVCFMEVYTERLAKHMTLFMWLNIQPSVYRDRRSFSAMKWSHNKLNVSDSEVNKEEQRDVQCKPWYLCLTLLKVSCWFLQLWRKSHVLNIFLSQSDTGYISSWSYRKDWCKEMKWRKTQSETLNKYVEVSWIYKGLWDSSHAGCCSPLICFIRWWISLLCLIITLYLWKKLQTGHADLRIEFHESLINQWTCGIFWWSSEELFSTGQHNSCMFTQIIFTVNLFWYV